MFKILVLIILLPFAVTSQSTDKKKEIKTPRLVVGIVVDQMRYDYIYRYWNKLGENGFKRLINGGFSCKNTKFDYVPTYTGPGHASIFTGTTPSVHGIIANDWYSRERRKSIYCTTDRNARTVGSSSTAGIMSPVNLLAPTVGDELRMSTTFKSKVIGIALKDRGAILPAGHTANAAYWLDNATGNWITSSFYINELPKWVNQFNDKKYVQQVLKGKWETLNPLDTYTESIADSNKYEGKFSGNAKSTFPHDLSLAFKRDTFDVIRYTPFGNTVTKDLAIEAIRQEKLGKDEFPDLLTLSFSSTDYIGHRFGPSSIEAEDAYLRLDGDIAELLAFLDAEIGSGEYILFLTSDHAAPEVPKYMHDNKIPGGYFNRNKIRDSLKVFLNKKYGDSLIAFVENQQVFFYNEVLRRRSIKREELENEVAAFYEALPGVTQTFTATSLKDMECSEGIKSYILRGFNPKRSGDVIYNLAPGWVEYYDKTGTTHGSAYSYDTHVPLIWFGSGIKAGTSVAPINITDIAPTLSLLLNINLPGASTGNPIKELLTK